MLARTPRTAPYLSTPPARRLTQKERRRLQAYRIGREIGLYSANDLRRFEKLNPRDDDEAEAFLSPMNMQSEQTRQPIADRS